MAEHEGTLDATPHKREQARKRGQVPRSHDLASALLLIAAVLLLMNLGGRLASFLAALTQRQLAGAAWRPLSRDQVVFESYQLLYELGWAMLPILGCMLLAGVFVHVGQTGILLVPEKVGFDPAHVNPISGFGRIFSIAGFARLGFGMVKVLLIAAVAGWSLWMDLDQVLGLMALDAGPVAATLWELTLATTLRVGLALLALAVLDFFFQRWKHERDLRMTHQEMMDEIKQTQGDPQIRARQRAVAREMVLKSARRRVPEADFVVTNPTELAVAIKYDMATMAAPIVVAKGAGELAQYIRRLALEHGIPIVERKPLARALYETVEVDHPIPVEQYAAVAEVLRYVYELQGKPLPSAPLGNRG